MRKDTAQLIPKKGGKHGFLSFLKKILAKPETESNYKHAKNQYFTSNYLCCCKALKQQNPCVARVLRCE